jgi:crotonobetaine/carnitine-CoA ligase
LSFATVAELLASAVDRFGGAPALITTDRSESFRELGQRTRTAAADLLRRGLQPGDRVLMAARNSPALVHLWLGTILAAGIPVPVNPELTESEMDYLRADLQPRFSFVGDEVASIGADFAEPGTVPLPTPWPPRKATAIVYTSGTTSRPKGVMVSDIAYCESGFSFPGWIGLEPGQPQRLWACLPLFHINAQAYSLMGTLAYGYGLALTPKFHASTFWRDARALAVTEVNMVGAMLEFLAAQPQSTWVESPLRTIYAAPSPPPAQRDELEARFRVRIISGYAMTENPFGCMESATSRAKAGSVGRPRQPQSRMWENQLRIVNRMGDAVEPGEVGELTFRNPAITPGYWNAPDVTAATIKDGWLHTGDAGYRDEDGDVFLTGRYKEMIRRRGENIAPAEVEDALLANPTVRAAAVFGVPAGLQEDEVVAAVVLRDGVASDEAALKAWAATRLAPFKVPSRIFYRDSLPMTPTHRVAKDVLRQEYGRLTN